ncbi:hypothetical protein EZV73_08270 [Acidaminobacter sp. JC074]|uniref:hypothetical protein n=1 Tax=Acidaminobacter sp. JC074 TaxID=2530199 RepID=UPI001F0D3314|nr:hypothetical protein [Acidaminobacter sp. JC074]MCH4887564.1 hypothetical protein [Acidaminobacter sp. JC074]
MIDTKMHVQAHTSFLKNYTEIEDKVNEYVDLMNQICNLKLISHHEMTLLAEASIIYNRYQPYFPRACSKIKKMQKYIIEKFLVIQG